MSSAMLMVVSGGGEVRNRNYSMAKILYEAKRRRRNSGAWGVARNTLIRFRLPYARTAAGLSPPDPAPLPTDRTPPPAAPSPANALNRPMERVNVDAEHPSWSAMLVTLKPRADGHPSTAATATTATLA